MFSRTLKAVESTQHIGRKARAFLPGRGHEEGAHRGAIQRSACQFEVGQRLETTWGHCKIYIEIKSKLWGKWVVGLFILHSWTQRSL